MKMIFQFVTYLFLSLLFLTGCAITSSKSEIVVLEDGCNIPGTVTNSQLDNSSQGYAYRFAIYLPPCYDAEASAGYPVIYMIPGRGGGTNDWFNAGINKTADALILTREINPFIIVGTETTNSDPYADQIYNHLIPHIDNAYNTNGERDFRAVGGGSLGGVASYRLAFKYPETFSTAGIFGAGVINGEDDQVKIWLGSITDENQVRVFLNTGEEDPLMLAQARVLSTYLEEAEISYELIIDEDGNHTYGYWFQSFEIYFKWVAKDWKK